MGVVLRPHPKKWTYWRNFLLEHVPFRFEHFIGLQGSDLQSTVCKSCKNINLTIPDQDLPCACCGEHLLFTLADLEL